MGEIRVIQVQGIWQTFCEFHCFEERADREFCALFQLPNGQSTHFQSVVHPDGQSHQFQTQTVHDVGNVIAARDEINQVGNMLVCYDMPSPLSPILCV